MKNLEFQAVVAGCSIKEFYDIAISDEEAISKFHKEANKDETVRVSSWSDGQRVVEFILSMSIPKSVQSFIGAGPIRIKERQAVTWLNDTTLQIVSEPEVQISYAKALVTKAELLICAIDQGVSIDVKVEVTASVPWPMQGTVESLMADQARKTVGQYVEWIGQYVETAMEQLNNTRLQEAIGAEEQQQMAVTSQLSGPPTPPESTVTAPASTALAAVPSQQTVVPQPNAAVAAQHMVAVPRAYTAAAAEDVFYDANEVVPGSALELLMRELREARESRDTTNRLLCSIRDSMQRVDNAVSRELAFQEGMRHAQIVGSSSSGYMWLLSVAMTAAAASAATAYIFTRRNVSR